MKTAELERQIALGEDSLHQFKVDIRNAESLAAEMAAFANSDGGTIYLGVADDGSCPGLNKADVARINQLISNATSQLVKSPTDRAHRKCIRGKRTCCHRFKGSQRAG
jgi:ATP-dependent DNA helicase RecG